MELRSLKFELKSNFMGKYTSDSLRKKCVYSEFYWSVFFRIRTEYGETRNISPYSVRMRGNIARKTPNTDTFQAVVFDRALNTRLITHIQKQPFAKNKIYIHAKNERYRGELEIGFKHYSEFRRKKLSQQLERCSIACRQVKDKGIQVIFMSYEDIYHSCNRVI